MPKACRGIGRGARPLSQRLHLVGGPGRLGAIIDDDDEYGNTDTGTKETMTCAG